MCGIAGVVSPDPAARSLRAVAPMAFALRHRGPDDEGIESRGDATLAARRLSIIDLAGGHQPMANERGDVIAVQNGEIYNFAELRRELETLGHRFHSRNDTEVLPHAYEEWDTRFVARLRGMFALALWDETRRRLVLARDRFGKKPLVYAQLGSTLLFGSEIQALLAHPAVSRAVDDAAIADYLAFGYVPAPRTAFAAIRKVPPAHFLTFEGGRVSVERYWSLRYRPKLDIAYPEAIEELRRRMDQAVRLRLISDVPLGAFLSGGLDSSTVVAFMAQHSDRPVKTFSIGFKDHAYDELAYARLVATRFGTDHHEFVVDASETDVLPMLVRHLGEPFADSSIVPTYHVARMTRTEVTVALNGDGGDELFAGYNHYRAVALANRLGSAIPHPLLATVAGVASAVPLPPTAPRPIRLGQRFAMALAWTPERRYVRWTGHFTGDRYRAIVGERLRGLAPERAEAAIREAMDAVGSDGAAEREMGADVTTALANGLLVKMDIATMASSLEARSPFLDHELAEFVARLPAQYKFSLRRSKRILRDAMRERLPAEILGRGKMGFSAPVGAWFRGPLKDTFAEIADHARVADDGFVAADGVARVFADHVAGRAENSRLLWNLLMLELWYRECVTAARPSDAVRS